MKINHTGHDEFRLHQLHVSYFPISYNRDESWCALKCALLERNTCGVVVIKLQEQRLDCAKVSPRTLLRTIPHALFKMIMARLAIRMR